MKNASIAFLWIIHISALIGILLGYESFFLEKSPFTICYLVALLFLWFPINKIKPLLLFIAVAITGIGVEWIGVHSGFLFGDYSYGENFGPKLDGIPYLIGLTWALLTFITNNIVRRYTGNIWVIAAIASSLMVFLDFFLEQICEYAGYWKFEHGAGPFNYFCWFFIAFVLQLLTSKFLKKGDFKISLHLYIVQLVFAALLWVLIYTT